MTTDERPARLTVADVAFEDGMLDHARAWVHAELPAKVPDHVREDVVLVTDTLVARAIRKRSRPIELRLRPGADGRSVRIEVQVLPTRVVDRLIAFPEGTGCDLIEQFSEDFGLEDGDAGSVLWAEISLNT